MHRQPRSLNYNGSCYCTDTSSIGNKIIDSHDHSTHHAYYGMQRMSYYGDKMNSRYPFTSIRHHGKDRASNYTHNVSSYYPSADGESYCKRSIQKHLSVLDLDLPSPNDKHCCKRITHRYKIDKRLSNPKHPHKKASGKKELRERLFQKALKPFSKDTGAPYPCSQHYIDFHRRDVFPVRNRGPFTTVREATKELMLHNDIKRPIPPVEKVAISKVLFAASKAQDGLIPGPDVAIKAFSDLDLIFFGGRLRNNVTVQWRPDITVPIRSWGICDRPQRGEEGQCRIKLNASMIFKKGWTTKTKNPFESMIGTLLHEMCHAYENVRSPHDLEPGDGHGELFGTRIAVVHKRALRILGLWAIERGEKHRQHYFFMPGCFEGQNDKYGSKDYVYCGKKRVRVRKEGNGKLHASGKRRDGQKADSGKKVGGKCDADGSLVKTMRQHNKWDWQKGPTCLIM